MRSPFPRNLTSDLFLSIVMSILHATMIQTSTELHWSMLCLCLSSTALSLLTQPVGTGKLATDFRHNLARLPPPTAGLFIVSDVLRFLRWKTLKIGDVDTCFWLTSRFHFGDLDMSQFDPAPEHKVLPKYSFARWTFFAGITTPLYIWLLASTGSPWTQFWATCFMLQFIVHEVHWRYFKRQRIILQVQDDWPSGPLAKIQYPEGEKPNGQKFFPDPDLLVQELLAEGDACESIKLLLSLTSEAAKAQRNMDGLGDASVELKIVRFWAAVTNEKFIWTCGHYRCLLYKLLGSARHPYISYLQLLTSFSLLLWVLHSDLRTLSIGWSERLLKIRFTYNSIVVIMRLSRYLFLSLSPNLIWQGGLGVLKQYPIFGYSFAGVANFLSNRWLQVLRVIIIFALVLTYGGILNYRRHPDIKATSMAWFLEIPIFIIWLSCGITFSGLLREESPIGYQATNGNSPSEKATVSREKSETSTFGEVPNPYPRQEISDNARLDYFNLVMLVPAALLWYAFCSRSDMPPLSPVNPAPHITDPRIVKLLLDGFEFV